MTHREIVVWSILTATAIASLITLTLRAMPSEFELQKREMMSAIHGSAAARQQVVDEILADGGYVTDLSVGTAAVNDIRGRVRFTAKLMAADQQFRALATSILKQWCVDNLPSVSKLEVSAAQRTWIEPIP